MHQEDQRNFIIAMVLMVLFIVAYQALFADPAARRADAAREAAAASEAEAPANAAVDTPSTPAERPISTDPAPSASASVRIPFDGPGVDGSIRLTGAVIDDLNLKRHFTTAKREEELRLLRPEAETHGYYASFFWRDAQGGGLATPVTEWDIVSGDRLTPNSPIVLRTSASGLTIDRTIRLDEDYLFTIEDTVRNTGSVERSVHSLGLVQRHGEYKGFLAATDPEASRGNTFGFKGLIGVLNNNLKQRNYSNLNKGRGIPGSEVQRTSDEGGWVAFTDKYWMTALIPQQDTLFTAAFRRRQAGGAPLFELTTRGADIVLRPGESVTTTNYVFAGAKRLEVLNGYKDSLAVPRFDDAVDWGFLYFLTKPFFYALLWLKSVTGGFGLAILAFTVAVKAVLFPLHNQAYKGMAKMKKLQEPMKEINERFASDPQRKQQEIMKLFQENKANPLAGCLPMLPMMPIFFALYQTLAVTLEMRHTPFLFVSDLSAPDPTAIGNLFGLLSSLYSAEAVKSIPLLGIVIGIGILPISYGLTMWALQSLSPPPADEMQRRIIMLLPLIFTFVFAGFAAGLVIYWLWSNILSLIQQYIIMRQNGVETQFDKLIARLRGRTGGEAA